MINLDNDKDEQNVVFSWEGVEHDEQNILDRGEDEGEDSEEGVEQVTDSEMCLMKRVRRLVCGLGLQRGMSKGCRGG